MSSNQRVIIKDVVPYSKYQDSSGVFFCAKEDTRATDRLLKTITDYHWKSVDEGHALQDENERKGYLMWADDELVSRGDPALAYDYDCQDCELKRRFDSITKNGSCSFSYVDTKDMEPKSNGSQPAKESSVRRAWVGLSDRGDSKYKLSYCLVTAHEHLDSRGHPNRVRYQYQDSDEFTLNGSTPNEKVHSLATVLLEQSRSDPTDDTVRHQVLEDLNNFEDAGSPCFGSRGGDTTDPITRAATALLSVLSNRTDDRKDGDETHQRIFPFRAAALIQLG